MERGYPAYSDAAPSPYEQRLRGQREYEVSPVEAYNPSTYRHTGSPSMYPSQFSPISPPAADTTSRDRFTPNVAPPPPPPHQRQTVASDQSENGDRYWGKSRGYSDSVRRGSTTTPGMDNLSEHAAGGGISGIAAEVANANNRESGLQALRDIDQLYGHPRSDSTAPYQNTPARYDASSSPVRRPRGHNASDSYGSSIALAPAAGAYGLSTPPLARNSTSRSPQRHDMYSGSPDRLRDYSPSRSYDPNPRSSYLGRPEQDNIDPRFIADDGDDDDFGVAAPAAAGALRQTFAPRDASGSYGPLPGSAGGAARPPGGGKFEKSQWLNHENQRRRRRKWIIIGVFAVILVLAAIGGAVGGVLASRNRSSSSTSPGASSSSADSGGDLTASSSEVKALMNNPALSKVFPAMDYTPLNAQYPDCLSNPPSQNNVTLDMAMLSQLTPAVRLYGTDCNQTEMVLTAIDRLNLNDSMTVWIGVWLGNNETTNERQLAQMYDILRTYPSSRFKGVIVGNEVLFRKDLTLEQLGDTLQGVRKNLTDMKIDLPVATSDLGDNWTAALAADTDIVMANVHPFFAGITPDKAAAWTWNFWQTKDVSLNSASGASSTTANGVARDIISEVGWPSEGGNDCGTGSGECPAGSGSVAGIDEMNTFLESWVCPALDNGTAYFWFEAFDEPWKHIFDTPTDGWESKWGLMDANRKVKDGLKIPSCGGKTA